MTNVNIVNDIDCLQLLQHSDGSERYLRVTTGETSWMIGYTIDVPSRWAISNTIDDPRCWIISASAGSSCPAHSENAFSERTGVKSWRYADSGWHEGDINLTCSTHS